MRQLKDLTYRVTQIPVDQTKDGLKELLSSGIPALGTPESIRVLSYATQISIFQPTKVATIAFDLTEVPSWMEKGSEWRVRSRDGRTSVVLDTHFVGLTVLNEIEASSHFVDCIFIHGLNGHPLGSWADKNQAHFAWVRDKLPTDVTGARCVLYGYDSHLVQSESFQSLEDLGRTLASQLDDLALCSSSEVKPIIFLAHSLGGIVLKSSLLTIALNLKKRLMRAIRQIILFGVPNTGMAISHLLPMVEDQPNEPLVRLLESASQGLQNLDEAFSRLISQLPTGGYSERIRLVSFYETSRSETTIRNFETGKWEASGPRAVLVDKTSAIHPGTSDEDQHPIDATHSSMVKFTGNDRPYKIVARYVQDEVLEDVQWLSLTRGEAFRGRVTSMSAHFRSSNLVASWINNLPAVTPMEARDVGQLPGRLISDNTLSRHQIRSESTTMQRMLAQFDQRKMLVGQASTLITRQTRQESAMVLPSPKIFPEYGGAMSRRLSIPSCNSSEAFFDAVSELIPSSDITIGSTSNLAYLGIFVDDDIWQTLPFVQFEQFLQSKNVALGRKARVSRFDGFSSAFSLSSILRQNQNLQSSLLQLGSMLPGEIPEKSTLITHNQAFETNFARMLVFSMLNGFAGLLDVSLEEILRFLNRVSVNRLLLDILCHSPKHISRTLSDNIFRAAFQDEDIKVVMQLVDRNLVDVNEIIHSRGPTFYYESYSTPIERAAQLGSLPLVRMLIDNGASIDKSYVCPRRGARQADVLGLLLANYDWRLWNFCANLENPNVVSDFMETLNAITTAGARVRPRHLFTKWGHSTLPEEVIGFIVQRIRPEDSEEFFDDELARLAEHTDEREAVQVFEYMLNLYAQYRGITDCRELPAIFTKDQQKIADEAVFFALWRGHTILAKLLLDKITLNHREPRFLTAAIMSENQVLIDLMFDYGSDPDPDAHKLRYDEMWDNRNTTPIAEAVRAGDEGLIRRLEEAGALDRLHQGGRFKVLMIAAAEQHDTTYLEKLLARAVTSKQAYRPTSRVLYSVMGRDVARKLLDAGADCTPFRMAGTTERLWPLHRAIELRDEREVRDIIEGGVHDANDIYYAEIDIMSIAFEWGDKSVIDLLIREFPDHQISSDAINRLYTKCMATDSIDFFKDFLDAAMNSRQWNRGLQKCLTTAVKLGHSDMVNYLLDMGGNPCHTDVLQVAIANQLDMLQLLFQDVRQRQIVPKCIGPRILASVMVGGPDNTEALDELLNTQAVNFTSFEELERGYSKFTPLGLAIQGTEMCPSNMVAMKKFLLAGADPNGIARKRSYREEGHPVMTALMIAVETGNKDAVEILLDHGADVDKQTILRTRRTPLQYAAELGNLEMVRLLISHGANVNGPPASRGGGTALQFAAISGNCNISAELLRQGAQLGALPSKIDGMWPLEGAATKGRLDMIRFLWEVKERALAAGVSCAGFSDRQCLRAMNFAGEHGHIGCRDFISELSGVSVDRLETDEYGAPWIAY